MKIFAYSICIFLFLARPLTSNAQFTGYGVKIGVQSADVAGNHFEANDRHIGFSLYFFADAKITPILFSTLDIGYTQRGFIRTQIQTNNQGESIGTTKAHSILHYLSVTPILKFRTSYGDVDPYIGIGPRFDYLVGHNAGFFHFQGYPETRDPTADFFDDTVFGFSIEAGITSLAINRSMFRIGLKYEWDVTDSLSNHFQSAKNNALMLTMGLNLNSW